MTESLFKRVFYCHFLVIVFSISSCSNTPAVAELAELKAQENLHSQDTQVSNSKLAATITVTTPGKEKTKESTVVRGSKEYLTLLEHLIYKSSASQHVLSVRNPEALQHYEQASADYQHAKQAQENGLVKERDAAIANAKTAFFKAVKLSGKHESSDVKRKKDIRHRIQNADEMFDAYKRITKQNKINPDSQKFIDSIEQELQLTKSALDSGELDLAQKKSDKAFSKLKMAVIKLRDGKTLVHNLNFSSPADEYLYEVNRNDTHKMLMKLFIKDKASTVNANSKVKEHISQAGDLRQLAAKLAQDKEFKQAIKQLENSTIHYIRAIQAAGIYIPG